MMGHCFSDDVNAHRFKLSASDYQRLVAGGLVKVNAQGKEVELYMPVSNIDTPEVSSDPNVFCFELTFEKHKVLSQGNVVRVERVGGQAVEFFLNDAF